MTIALTGTGGLFTRLGKLGGMMNNINGLLASTAPNPGSAWGSGGPAIAAFGSAVDGIEAQFQSADRNLMDGLYGQRDSFRSQHIGFIQYLQSLAINTLISQANDDTPLPSLTVPAALALLNQQMLASASYLAPSSVAAGAQTSVGTPTGTPSIVVSVKDSLGYVQQTAIPETLLFLCSTDSYSGGATAGQEIVSVLGQNAQPNQLSWDWFTSAYGSGASASVAAVDARVDNSGGNALVNGDFETFSTSNVPDNWTLVAPSVAGTDILKSSTAYTGSSSLEILGDGTTLSNFTQTFNTASTTTAGAGGTPFVLTPNTQYAVNFWYKSSASSVAAGTLQVDLIDGSNVIINDAYGTANSKTLGHAAIVDTSWHPFSVVFRTPTVLPATVKLRVHLTVAWTNTDFLLIDQLAMTPMTQLYAGGPWVAVFSGATNLVDGFSPDTFTVAITDTPGAMVKVLQQFFNLAGLGLTLPYTGSAAIPDNLVTSP